MGRIGRRTGDISARRSSEGSVDTTPRHAVKLRRLIASTPQLLARCESESAGVSAIPLSAAIWRQQRIDDLAAPRELLKQALQPLSPEPQPGPRWGGMLAEVMAARARNGGGMR